MRVAPLGHRVHRSGRRPGPARATRMPHQCNRHRLRPSERTSSSGWRIEFVAINPQRSMRRRSAPRVCCPTRRSRSTGSMWSRSPTRRVTSEPPRVTWGVREDVQCECRRGPRQPNSLGLDCRRRAVDLAVSTVHVGGRPTPHPVSAAPVPIVMGGTPAALPGTRATLTDHVRARSRPPKTEVPRTNVLLSCARVTGVLCRIS